MPWQSPIHELTAAEGANFTESEGAILPAHFGDPRKEYVAATTQAAIFDSSDSGKLRLTGPDAPMFLGNLSTNDIKNLPLGGGCQTYFCDSRAKALFQSFVYHIRLSDGRNALWLETTSGRNEALAKYLDRFLISEVVEIEDMTSQFAQFHLAGPQAESILASALGEPIPPLREFLHMERTFGRTSTCSIRRHDPLGVPGFDIVCLNERGAGVWRMLKASGAVPSGLQVSETLRIEAGTPVYGQDIDETRFVMEVGDAPRSVSYSKGCYLGQEPIVMSRDRAGHAPRSFVGLRSLKGEMLPVGSPLMANGEEIGAITSSTESPRLGCWVALGYVKWKHREVGTQLEIETASGRRDVEVVSLPMIPMKP